MFCFKNSGLEYNGFVYSLFFVLYFLNAFLTLELLTSLLSPLFLQKAPIQWIRDFSFLILRRTFVYRFLAFQSVYDCVVVCGLQKPKSPHFCNDTHPTLWWLCLKIFTITCSESSALFLYRSLPVRSALSGRLLILWDLPQMFYTFLVFRVLYVLETTFVFHFMIIKENIQVSVLKVLS